MIEKVQISDANVIESIRANMPTATSSLNGLLSADGTYKMLQAYKIGLSLNAIQIKNIYNWERLSFMFFGMHILTPYCAYISIYNYNNDDNHAPVVHVDKILDKFPFKVYYKKIVGSPLELLIKQTENSTGDDESANVLGNRKTTALMIEDLAGYTEVTI